MWNPNVLSRILLILFDVGMTFEEFQLSGVRSFVRQDLDKNGKVTFGEKKVKKTDVKKSEINLASKEKTKAY